MLILILMNVHYLQNIVFSFGGSNGQNHSLSDSHHPRFPILTLGEGGFPLKKTGDGSIYTYLQNFKIFMLMIVL